MKGLIKGTIILVIGGVVFTVNRADVVKHFSKDTGLSQQEAEQYIENIPEDELVSYGELGSFLIVEGQEMLDITSKIDCVNDIYDWESSTLSCEKGKSQMKKFGNGEIVLGEACVKLASESASIDDIRSVINFIDKHNANYSLEIIIQILDYAIINESKNTHLYNKAMLQSVLDSN